MSQIYCILSFPKLIHFFQSRIHTAQHLFSLFKFHHNLLSLLDKNAHVCCDLRLYGRVDCECFIKSPMSASLLTTEY